MTFEQALAVKMESYDLEYYLRAARIVNWVANEGPGLSDDEKEELFQVIVDQLANSADEFDEIALDLANEIAANRD